jgi:hypothetical protein
MVYGDGKMLPPPPPQLLRLGLVLTGARTREGQDGVRSDSPVILNE